jgi:hypothetical protein
MTEMSLQIGLLGPFRVCVDGERVDVPPRRLRDLLATLALSAGQSVSVDRLATAVWGEGFAVDVRVNLQSNVRRLRRLVGADAIRTRDRGYQLDVEPDDVDALRFHRLLGEVAATYDREKLSNALNLWRGLRSPERDRTGSNMISRPARQMTSRRWCSNCAPSRSGDRIASPDTSPRSVTARSRSASPSLGYR